MRVNYGLDPGILGGIDLQSARIQQAVGLFLGITGFLKVAAYLLRQPVNEVAVGRPGGAVSGVDGLYALIDVVRHGLIILFFGNVAILFHVLENDFSFFGVFVRVGNRVILVGVLSDAGDGGTLRESELAYILAEIPLGGRLDSEAVRSKVYRVQIVLKDLLLGHDVLKLDSQVLFLDLSHEAGTQCLLLTAIKNIVLDELLCDRARALGARAGALDSRIGCPYYASEVYAFMIPEA